MAENTNIQQQSIPSNPLLDRIQMPGEFFTLPSGGVFYTHGELDESVKNAEIRVNPMTAIDEITIKSPDLLFSGDAVREVFRRCIPQIKDIDNMLAKDVDYLLACLRKVSFGEQMQISHKHDCKDAKEHTYEVSISDCLRRAKKIDPTTIEKNFSIVLPNQQTIKLQPITYLSFIKMLQATDTEKLTAEQTKDMMIDSVASVIVSVDEITDKEMIRGWLESIPPSYFKLIREQLDQSAEWGPVFKSKVRCRDCKKQVEVTLPTNPLVFFT